MVTILAETHTTHIGNVHFFTAAGAMPEDRQANCAAASEWQTLPRGAAPLALLSGACVRAACCHSFQRSAYMTLSSQNKCERHCFFTAAIETWYFCPLGPMMAHHGWCEVGA
jgi:hypothetical protein